MNTIPKAAMGAVVALAVAVAWAEPKPPEPPPLEKPAPPPAHVNSSEGMAPLPYPAVFQKRQEKKNPPVPPVLVTKIRTADAEDWARTPNDIKGLLQSMSSGMNVSFSSNIKSFKDISSDPAKNPVLYRSGYKPFKLDEREAKNLRQYILNGGTLIFNALVGHPDFYKSALQAARDILPEQPVYQLRIDHPVFHSFYNIEKVKYRARTVKDGMVPSQISYPHLDGVDVDNRTAIFISRWDFSCGWESNKHEAWGYENEDARKLGANVFSYVTAMRDAGRSVGKSVELINADKKTAGKFRVGQVMHNGMWRTRTAAFPMLLNAFHTVTGTPVSFELNQVSLADSSVYAYPFLYLTGTTDFTLSETERANLRRFLANGGVLFVEAGEGRASFDTAFRQEMAQVLPGRSLAPLPAGSTLFREPMGVASVKARPALAAKRSNQVEMAPEIYGIELNGTMSVIYSPFDLSAGWEGALAPYALGYEAADAKNIGINILFSAVAR
ncbi:MAG: DUF4159 domain-containing protein [Verrucomicrobia bacterium]|nr:DUF4159 domain-containing protein [Verrucomicrobiota bacterium]